MNTSTLKRHAELLIDAINLVESCEKNLSNIETMPYYHIFGKLAERKIDITNAKEQLSMATDTLERQTRYISLEIEHYQNKSCKK